MASKTVSSREEAEARKEKAADFMRRIGNDEAADDFESMSTDEYIDHAGLTVAANPKNRGRRRCMANGNGNTKADLQEILDNVQELLDNVYTPESSREDMAAAIGDALDAISGEEEDEDGEDLDDDDDANGD